MMYYGHRYIGSTPMHIWLFIFNKIRLIVSYWNIEFLIQGFRAIDTNATGAYLFLFYTRIF